MNTKAAKPVQVYEGDGLSRGLIAMSEHLAAEVTALSEGFQALQSTRMTMHLIVLLIHEKTKVPKRQIEKVLSSLPNLEAAFLKATP